MRRMSKYFIIAVIAGFMATSVQAGNEDRAGSAGASYLLVNPWARSSGLAGSNIANARGVESTFLNVAGLAFINKTEFVFSQTLWLGGAGSNVNINSFGLAQRINDASVIGLTVNNWNFGKISRTTANQPEGDGTEYSPNVLNIAASYGREFSNSIYGGLTLRVLSESTADIKASGVAFDAGIKYVTGENDQVKIGITLKNVGPDMKYSGDGLSVLASLTGTETELTVEQRSANSELPSLVAIGASYDFLISESHRITPSGAFVANSFTKDNFLVGIEYAFKELFQLRGGYLYEGGITNSVDRTTAFTGLHAGLSVMVPVNKKGSYIGIDYSYRTTNPFNGVHSIGLSFDLK
jgi:hypothetical protein